MNNRIDNKEPINNQTRNVVSNYKYKGAENVFINNRNIIRSNSIIPYCNFKGKSEHDLTGIRIGRLTILGVAYKRTVTVGGVQKKTSWVVRCDCGYYEIRNRKSLVKTIKSNIKIDESMRFYCGNCLDRKFLQRKLKKLSKRNIKTPIDRIEIESNQNKRILDNIKINKQLHKNNK